jgi:hypothetical protein
MDVGHGRWSREVRGHVQPDYCRIMAKQSMVIFTRVVSCGMMVDTAKGEISSA